MEVRSRAANNERRRLLVAGAVLIVAVAVVTGASALLFYRESIHQSTDWLQSVVRTQASLMETMAAQDSGSPGGAAKPLEEIWATWPDESGFGRSGEFVLGRRIGDTIAFLLPERLAGNRIPAPVPYDSRLAEPMRRALGGATGSVIAPDYRGEEVLAAYTPIHGLGVGLVAKIDLTEIRAPLIQAGLWTAAAMIAVGAVGVLLARSLTRPIIHSLETRTRRLEDLSRDLARSNAELEQFAYVASHDLKAPLRGIDNLVEWLSQDLEGTLSGDNLRHMALLKGRTARMEALLDGLLDYSRIGRKNLDRERVDTGQMIRALADLLAPPEGMEITCNAHMPVFTTPKVPLEMVFRNLLSNALKHHDMESGAIHVEGRDKGWYHEFAVRDDGPGIPPDFHDRVFGIFQTLKPRDDVEGSGMGLALVKKTVEHFGGTVSIDSDPAKGRGTTVRFTWPKTEETA